MTSTTSFGQAWSQEYPYQWRCLEGSTASWIRCSTVNLVSHLTRRKTAKKYTARMQNHDVTAWPAPAWLPDRILHNVILILLMKWFPKRTHRMLRNPELMWNFEKSAYSYSLFNPCSIIHFTKRYEWIESAATRIFLNLGSTYLIVCTGCMVHCTHVVESFVAIARIRCDICRIWTATNKCTWSTRPCTIVFQVALQMHMPTILLKLASYSSILCIHEKQLL